MNALAPYIAALHQQDLLEEASLRSLVRASRSTQPRVALWRRGLGLAARGLSAAFASAARTLDPGAEARGTSRSTQRHPHRATAA